MSTDPLQTSALNALAPFVALAPTATSPRAAADLVSQAVAAPGTYVFAELLQTPNVQKLQEADAPYSGWYRVLELFCWGTWGEYTTQREAGSSLPALNPTQSHKLRLLTLLTLAHTPSTLSYPSLQTALALPSTTDLEALLTTAISASLITARLNPALHRVDVASVAPLRDLPPGNVPALIHALGQWEEQCASVLHEVEERAARVRAQAQARGRGDAEWKAMFDERVGIPAGGKGGKDDDGKGPGGKRPPAGDADGGDAKRGGSSKIATGGRRVGTALNA